MTTNIVNVNDPKANMYGCLPCPKCKKPYRYVHKRTPWHGVPPDHEYDIICDNCGYTESAVVEAM